jgi:ubiquinone/menaquinone biosynthesis C-methylase UbiE
MIMDRKKFYKKKILDHIKNLNSSILVLGAGDLDKDIFQELNYKNVKLSNINNNDNIKNIEIQNLHNLKINDESYDYCVAHACIHHSSKPHSALLEMYRVSKKGILIIEAADTIISRLACKIRLSEEFEISAVKKNKTFGGVDNSSIPNFVFRWTEREIYKLFSSFEPGIIHKISYDYGNQLKFTNSRFVKLLFKFFFYFFKKQQNLFSIFINKEDSKSNLRKW